MTDHGATIFPFGKHKGSPLREIPVGYLDWALGIELSPQLRVSIQSYLKTQAEYDQFKAESDWKEGREDAEDWRTM